MATNSFYPGVGAKISRGALEAGATEARGAADRASEWWVKKKNQKKSYKMEKKHWNFWPEKNQESAKYDKLKSYSKALT